ncbi:MAG TPA: hypothetical protein VFE00_02915 [Arthrobacter sp.]|nr:hypothetical protein [Arthrobacter sp.]
MSVLRIDTPNWFWISVLQPGCDGCGAVSGLADEIGGDALLVGCFRHRLQLGGERADPFGGLLLAGHIGGFFLGQIGLGA